MLAAFDRKLGRPELVKNVNRTEGSAVHLQRFTVLFRRVAVAFVERICFYDLGFCGQVRHQRLDPFSRNDVGAVLFPRVKLQSRFPRNRAGNCRIDAAQAVSRQVSSKPDARRCASAFLERDIDAAASRVDRNGAGIASLCGARPANPSS